MAVDPIEAIETRELVETVNRRERPRRFLTQLLFPMATHRPLDTEYVQVDELTGEDSMAPFISPTYQSAMPKSVIRAMGAVI